MPLRASNLSYNDLRHVVILGNLEFLRRYNFNYSILVPFIIFKYFSQLQVLFSLYQSQNVLERLGISEDYVCTMF